MTHGFLNRRLFHVVAATVMLAMALTSCTSDEELDTTTNEPAPNDMVSLTLLTNANDYQVPVTRTPAYSNDDEDQGDHTSFSTARLPMVLVFQLPEAKMADYNDSGATEQTKAELLRTEAVFSEAVQAVAGNEGPKVMLSATTRPVRLLIVGNPPVNYFNGTTTTAFSSTTISASLAGKKFTEAVNGMLNTAKLTATSGVVGSVPYVGDHIPMTAIKDYPAITTDVKSIGENGSKIFLKRVAAKITVSNEAAGFVFEGATVLDTKQYGLLYRDYVPATDKYTTPPTGNKVNYLSGTGTARVTGIAASSSAVAGQGNTTENPIYIYESAAGEVIVLVQGKYNNTPSWYRLSLKSQTDGKALAVDRNKHYRVHIKSVDRVGHASIDAALAATNSDNILSEVTVSDLSGHEMVDNGSYYLGLSNSVFLHWSSDTVRQEVLTTISTDAPSGTAISVTKTAGNEGITLNWVSRTAPGGETAIELKGTFEAEFIADGDKKALYTIKVGMLEKQLLVMQQGISVLSVAGSESELTGQNYVAASVEEGQEWLSLAMGDDDYTTHLVHTNKNGGVLKLKWEDGIEPSTNDIRFGEIMASRTPTAEYAVTVGTATFRSTGARVKISIGQNTLPDPGEIIGAGNVDITAYVGAFWKAAHKGERLIDIQLPTGTQYAGDWCVQVLDYGVGANRFSEGDVLFEHWDGDLSNVTSPNVDASDDLAALGAGAKALLSEDPVANGGKITFKIGLGSPIDKNEHRYARIVVSFGTKDGKKYGYNRVIWLRQGEAPDYVMAQGDPGMPDAPTRPDAKPWSPYNLTAKTWPSNDAEFVQIKKRDWDDGGYIDGTGDSEPDFAAYPTMAGAMFQWAQATDATGQLWQRRAFNPGLTTYATAGWNGASYSGWTWDDELHETCPEGYRRPDIKIQGDGVAGNETWQSFVSTQASVSANSAWGYYADGYFDRLQVEASEGSSANSSPSVVARGGKDAAYIGRIIFNDSQSSTTHYNASLFVPAAGTRYYSSGALYFAGSYGYSWSRLASSLNSSRGCSYNVDSGGLNPYNNNYKSGGFSVRCVYDPD